MPRSSTGPDQPAPPAAGRPPGTCRSGPALRWVACDWRGYRPAGSPADLRAWMPPPKCDDRHGRVPTRTYTLAVPSTGDDVLGRADLHLHTRASDGLMSA